LIAFGVGSMPSGRATSEVVKQEILRLRFSDDVHARMTGRAFRAAHCQSWRLSEPVPSSSAVYTILCRAAANNVQVCSIMFCNHLFLDLGATDIAHRDASSHYSISDRCGKAQQVDLRFSPVVYVLQRCHLLLDMVPTPAGCCGGFQWFLLPNHVTRATG